MTEGAIPVWSFGPGRSRDTGSDMNGVRHTRQATFFGAGRT